jgi:hypothetical protein
VISAEDLLLIVGPIVMLLIGAMIFAISAGISRPKADEAEGWRER